MIQSIDWIKLELANENYCTEYEIRPAPTIAIIDKNIDTINNILNGYNLFIFYTLFLNTRIANILLNTI